MNTCRRYSYRFPSSTRHLLGVVSIVLSSALPSIAAEAQPWDAKAVVNRAAPYVMEDTFFVARVDLTKIDLPAAAARARQVYLRLNDKPELVEKNVQAVLALVRPWLASFRAAGGRDAFVVVSLTLIEREAPPIIIPLQAGADSQKICSLAEVIKPGKTHKVVVVGRAVVVATPRELERIRTRLKAGPVDRPELGRAFHACGPAVVQAVLIPTADMRKVFEEVEPDLPRDCGGGSMRVLTRGVLWAAAGVTLPPDVTLRVVAQSQDPAAATIFRRALPDLTRGGLRILGDELDLGMPSIDKRYMGVLTPRIEHDRMVLTLNSKQLDELVDKHVSAILKDNRRRDALSKEFRAMREVIVAIRRYENGHQNQWPASLQQLVQAKLLSETVLKGPQGQQRFIYVRPSRRPDKIESTENTVILYCFRPDLGAPVIVGFVDGHVEPTNDKQDFDEMLNRQAKRKANGKDGS